MHIKEVLVAVLTMLSIASIPTGAVWFISQDLKVEMREGFKLVNDKLDHINMRVVALETKSQRR